MRFRTVVADVQSDESVIIRRHIMDGPAGETPTPKALEQEMDLSFSTIYKVLRGELRFQSPAGTIEGYPELYQALGCPLDLLRHTVSRCEPRARLTIAPAADDLDGSVVDQHEEMLVSLARAVESNRDAMKNHHWSGTEIARQMDIYLDIMNQINTAIAELEMIRKRNNDRAGRTELAKVR